MTGKSTSVDLVRELRSLEYRSRGIDLMIAEAEAHEYHDYKNNLYACGKVEVMSKLAAEAARPATPRLVRAALMDLRRRVSDGEFDEEADEADVEEMRRTTPRELWPVLGLEVKH